MEFIQDPDTLETVYGPVDAWSGAEDNLPRASLVTDEHLAFLQMATMVVVASIDHGGVTCSPRGGAPGSLALVRDPQTVWVPDAAGGRMHQTVRNLMGDPRLGLLFLVPWRQEVLRLQGMARVSADPEALKAFPVLDPPVRSVLVVDVQSVRLSGSGPVTRAALWIDSMTT